MNNFLDQHIEEIISQFKNHFYSAKDQNRKVNFDQLVKMVLLEYQLESISYELNVKLSTWFNHIEHLNFIKTTMRENHFEEIIFHRHDLIQLIANGQKKNIEVNALDQKDFQRSLQYWTINQHLNWNHTHPFCSFDFHFNGDNFRITLIHASTTPNNQSKVFIRKHHQSICFLKNFTQDQNAIHLINEIVSDKRNVIIAGSTGSGKTSLMRTMMTNIEETEHVIILEDTHELSLEHKNATYMLSNQDEQKKSLTDYCSYAMRMSPDRLLIGELRSKEVIPFILAMNTGHKGLMSTIHANSAKDTIDRLKMLFCIYGDNQNINTRFVTDLICKNLETIIFVENKTIKEIIKIYGSEDEMPFFETMYLKAS